MSTVDTIAPYKIVRTPAFPTLFLADLEQAKQQIAVQFMTFEGDAAGWLIANSLIRQAQRGVRVRALVDYFSNYYLSDRFLIFPQTWPEFWETQRMYKIMREAGVELQRSGPPLRPTLHHLLQRNHKKLAIIDDIAYLGGINISDHNFSWHDFMVRLTGPETADLQADFDASWAGRVQPPRGNLLHSGQLQTKLRQLLLEAKNEIIISSPYLWDLPTVNTLIQAAKNGCRVVVLSLQRNNFTSIRLGATYLLHLLQKSGVTVYFYDNFSHAKYLIVDRAVVLFGSANFCYNSYAITEELCMVSRDPVLVQLFIRDLYEAEAAHIRPAPVVEQPSLTGRLASWLLWQFLQLHRRDFPTYSQVSRAHSIAPGD